MPAGGKKKRNPACHVGFDLSAKGVEGLFEQRAQQDRHGDEIEEEARGRRKVLRGEGWQRRKLVRLRQFA